MKDTGTTGSNMEKAFTANLMASNAEEDGMKASASRGSMSLANNNEQNT